MSDASPESLTERDLLVIRETIADIESAPPPTDMGHLGCPAAILGGLLLVAWPKLLELLPAAGFFTPFVMLAAVLMMIGGPVAAFTAGGFVRGASIAAAEAALRQLESDEDDREVMLRAATLLLMNAFVSSGPGATMAFNPDGVASRIGDSFPLVVAVEKHLIDVVLTHPVFTAVASEQSDDMAD